MGFILVSGLKPLRAKDRHLVRGLVDEFLDPKKTLCLCIVSMKTKDLPLSFR
jgi:hypothetical protein